MKFSKRLSLLVFEAILFVIASLAVFTCVASLANAIGSTNSQLSRMGPYYLSVAALVYSLFILHLSLFPKNEAKLKLTLKVNGIALSGIALLAAVLILVKVATKEYSSMIAGVLSPLFPLDAFLWDFGLFLLGGFIAYKGFRYKGDPERIFYPYEHGLVRQILGSFFRGLYLVIALYLTGAAIMEVGIANYGSPTWWCMIGLWLLMLVPSALLFYHEFFYKKAEGRSALANRKISLIILSGTLFLTIYFLIALLIKRNFIVEDATALFLLDYMKSWNAVPYVVSLMANLPPLVAFLFTLKKGQEKEKSPQKPAEANQKEE